jgi:hypothetical protein
LDIYGLTGKIFSDGKARKVEGNQRISAVRKAGFPGLPKDSLAFPPLLKSYTSVRSGLMRAAGHSGGRMK